MISFIIPTKNEEKALEKTLLCLSEYKGEKEIIISDGKSTDKTISIAKKYTDKIVEHDGLTKQTIGEGRNTGADIANGEYFVFIDADVYIPNINSFFENITDIFNKKNISGLTVNVCVEKEQETLSDKIIFSILNFYNFILNNYLNIGASPGEFQMFKKEVFKNMNGYNKNLVAGEDYELFVRIAKKYKTYFVKNLRVYHTGRRAHKVGWPKLLLIWFLNNFSVILKGKSFSKEWKIIR